MPAISTFTGVGVSPFVGSAVNFSDGLKVRVLFNEPMANTSALTDPATYTVVALSSQPAFQPVSVVAEGVTNPTYVELTLANPLETGINNFEVDVSTSVTDVAGNPLNNTANYAVFSGIGVPSVVTTPALTTLETHLVSSWTEDPALPNLSRFRNSLSELTQANGKQIISYGMLSPFRNYIFGSHPDLDLFDPSDVVNRVRISSAAVVGSAYRNVSRDIIKEAGSVGVDPSLTDKFESIFLSLSVDDDIGITQLLVVVLIAAAIVTI